MLKVKYILWACLGLGLAPHYALAYNYNEPPPPKSAPPVVVTAEVIPSEQGPKPPSFYLALGGNFNALTQTTSTPLPNMPAANTSTTTSLFNSFAIDGGVNFNSTPIRLEVEFSGSEPQVSNNSAINSHFKTTNYTLMGNLYYDIGHKRLKPYIGVGLGSRLASIDQSIDSGNGTASFSGIAYGLAYSGKIGLTFDITEHVGVSLGYSYTNLGKVSTTPTSSTGTTNFNETEMINAATLRLIYNF